VTRSSACSRTGAAYRGGGASPRLAQPRSAIFVDSVPGPVPQRWKIERTFAWLGNFRRLVVRWDRSLTIYSAFFHLACALVTMRAL